MSNELIIRSMSDVATAAKAMAASGYFTDAREMAQAAVKIMAGQEMGFGPFASMTGVYIISGKPSIGANLMAGAVKASSKYDYRVVEMTEKSCALDFYESGQKIGTSTFTIDEARKAGVKNLDKFPRNMLFARAMSNGVRWFCPDVFNGAPTYTPEELGADVNEDGDIIDVTPTQSSIKPQQAETEPEPEAEYPSWVASVGTSDSEPYIMLENDRLREIVTGTAEKLPEATGAKKAELQKRHDAAEKILQYRKSQQAQQTALV